MKNYLLIGGAGFIGASIAKKLIDDGNNVSILEREDTNLSRLDQIKDKVIIHFVALNEIEKIKDILLKQSITDVLHLASSMIPSSDIKQYEFDFQNIIFPTIKLLPIFSEFKIRLIFFSSGGAVYGKKDDGFFREDDSLNPISYYGQSKLILEESIKFENRKTNLSYIILRPSNPYGIGQSLYGKQGIIATSIQNILTGQKIQIWGDGSVVRDYIYIDDFVSIVSQIMDKNVGNNIYNVGSGIGYSINQIIEILKNCTNYTIPIEYLSSRNVDAPSIILDTTKLKNILDFNFTDIKKGIELFFNYQLSTKEK